MAPGRKRGAAAVSPEANATRPTRSRQLPTCFRESATQWDGDGEYIDPNPLDESTSESSDDASQCAGDNHTTGTLATAITDPLVTNHSSKGGNVAYDIHHFFRKEQNATVCLPCE
jgi:hypothetical protein